MAKSDIDAAVASETRQGRSAMGAEGRKFSSPSAKPASGTLRPKGNAAAGDPAVEAKPARSATLAESHGAAHTIITNIVKPNDPAAGATLANAKVIPSTIKRGGFEAGIESAY